MTDMSPSEFDELEAQIERAHRRRHRKEMLWTVGISFVALLVAISLLVWLWTAIGPLSK